MRHRQLRRGSWTVQELERLRQLFPRHGVRTTAELLRRSQDSVRRKALDLLQTPTQRGPWTADDDLRLRLSWGALDPRLLGQVLGRPLREVVARAARLRGQLRSGPWTQHELGMLKNLYGTRTDEDLELALLRPRGEIAATAAQLCLAKDKRFARRNHKAGHSPMPRWTDPEVERLRAVYPDHDNLAVARLLGRTVASVANKASQLGLRKSRDLLARIGRTNIAQRRRD